jgi:hypothetical protein
VDEIFSHFDTHKDDQLDHCEVHRMLLSLGFNLNVRQLILFIKAVDQNNDMKISTQELKDFLMISGSHGMILPDITTTFSVMEMDYENGLKRLDEEVKLIEQQSQNLIAMQKKRLGEVVSSDSQIDSVETEETSNPKETNQNIRWDFTRGRLPRYFNMVYGCKDIICDSVHEKAKQTFLRIEA